MRAALLSIALAGLTPHGSAQGGPPPELEALALPPLSSDSVAHWRTLVRPSAREASYEAIAWLDDFASGVRKASEQKRPLLFWAMNGHPLGCT